MSSEPSERAPSAQAKAWVAENVGGYTDIGGESCDRTVAFAYDAGFSEGEKKGAAVGYLAALRELRHEVALWDRGSNPDYETAALENRRQKILTWLDRRIREAES